MRIFCLLSILAYSLTACSASQTEASMVGGASGAVLGAGTGAAIGAGMANGDIAASAALGGAVGLGVGVAAGLGYVYATETQPLNRNARQIRANQDKLGRDQESIEQFRAKVAEESEAIELDQERRRYEYVGPSIGMNFR